MLYIFYKTTNLINDKYYYGIHTTNNINDNYLGSGTALKKAIKKYGRHNFRKDILFLADSQEDLIRIEEFFVTTQLVLDPNCYNLREGGKGYRAGQLHPFYGKKRDRDIVDKITKANTGKKRTPEAIENSRKALLGFKHTKEWIENHKLFMSTNHPFKNKNHSFESKLQMAKKRQLVNNGVFYTPYGEFNTLLEATQCCLCGKKAIMNRCIKNCDSPVGFNRSIPKKYRGNHTWRSIGWYFISSGQV